MKASRREIIASMAAAAGAFGSGTGFAVAAELQEDATFPDLPASLAQYTQRNAYRGPLPTVATRGLERPAPEEVAGAALVLAGLQKVSHQTPREIAEYFDGVGHGSLGEMYRPYIAAWPVRWNPVIVEFFTSTGTNPSGDTTAWCAAFLNWCLLKSTIGSQTVSDGATHSASSGSFRTWGMPTTAPREGDIVVFKDSDPERAREGYGHVGLYLNEDNDHVLVLGGNQLVGTPRRHMICRHRIAKKGVLTLHSYRTNQRLHP